MTEILQNVGETEKTDMSEKKEDRRTAYSKKIIRESLYELMREKPLNKITVREICETADVNRSTFYAYYADIYDLHAQIIKEFFRHQHRIIKNACAVLAQKEDITDLTVNDFYEIFFYYISTIRDNRELYKFIFNQYSSVAIFVSFGKLFYHSVKKMLPENTPEKIANALFQSFKFVNGGTTALLLEWLKNDCMSDTAEHLARQISYYCYGVFNGYNNKKSAGKAPAGISKKQ